MSWMQLAKAHFSEKRPECTDKTDERGVLAVSSVPSCTVLQFPHRVSSVSSVGVVALFENCISADELLKVAMRACDHWGDGEKAREEMRTQCLEVPPHLRGELLEYFKQQYPAQPEESQ